MKRAFLYFWLLFLMSFVLIPSWRAEEAVKLSYSDFSEPKQCSVCHPEIYGEWQQSLMSQCFTHPWDEAEYFKLALPQALKGVSL